MEMPTSGGRWIRDPVSGALTRAVETEAATTASVVEAVAADDVVTTIGEATAEIITDTTATRRTSK